MFRRMLIEVDMKKLLIIAAFTMIGFSAHAEVGTSGGVGPMAKEELRGGQFICDEKIVNKDDLNVAKYQKSADGQEIRVESAQ